MRMHIYKLLLVTTRFLCAVVCAMDAPLPKTEPITKEHFKILELPADLQAKVATFVMTGKTIEEATKNIRALAQTNRQFHQLLNDDQVTQELISLLQKRFNIRRKWSAAIQLWTPGAGRWLANHYKQNSDAIDDYFLNKVYGNVELPLIQFLVEYIPDASTKSRALRFAIKNKNSALVESLLNKNANPNYLFLGEPGGQTPLELAMNAEAPIEIIRLLLNAGADTNEGHFVVSQSPLMKAVVGNNVALVKLLLDFGADTELLGLSDRTPLIEATQHGYSQIVKLLLKAGANPNFAIRLGTNSLMIAAHYGHTEIIKLLLRFGADINAQKSNGETALMDAVRENRPNIVRLLLESGADLTIRNRQDKTALEIAELSGQEDNRRIIELFKNPPSRKSLSKKLQ